MKIKLPVSRKRYDAEVLAHKKLQESYEAKVQENYQEALSKIKAELRSFLVDWNYELFNSTDSLLRSKIYNLMANGLAQFHERA